MRTESFYDFSICTNTICFNFSVLIEWVSLDLNLGKEYKTRGPLLTKTPLSNNYPQIVQLPCRILTIVEIIGFYLYRGHILSLHFSMGGRIHEHHFRNLRNVQPRERTPIAGGTANHKWQRSVSTRIFFMLLVRILDEEESRISYQHCESHNINETSILNNG